MNPKSNSSLPVSISGEPGLQVCQAQSEEFLIACSSHWQIDFLLTNNSLKCLVLVHLHWVGT